MKNLGAAGPMVADMGSMYMKSPGAAGPMVADMGEWKVENEKKSSILSAEQNKQGTGREAQTKK